MKNPAVCTALIIMSLHGKLYAQETKPVTLTKTESSFNIHPLTVNNRHWVYFPKDEKMIIEMYNTKDYEMIAHLDSLMATVVKDIDFYKDSLSTTGSVTIDYAFTLNSDIRKIRFKKYEPDGDLFIDKQNEVSKLKIDQDTINVLFRKAAKEKSHYDVNTGHLVFYGDTSVQVTFCLNNYTDMNLILQHKGMLNHIIDTLAITSKPKRVHRNPSFHPSTIYYWPFDTGSITKSNRFQKFNYLKDANNDGFTGRNVLVVNGGVGVGVIKNTLTPMADIGAEVNWRKKSSLNSFNIIRLSATPYFFFDKNAQGSAIVQDNWFANLEFGTGNKDKKNYSTVGIGYLYAEKGGYLQNTVMKAFVSMQVHKQFIICPELIFNNDFKQIFPGLTLKVLNSE